MSSMPISNDYPKGTVVEARGSKWVVVASKKDLEDRYARDGQPHKNLTGCALSPYTYYEQNIKLNVQQIHEDLLSSSRIPHGKGVRYITISTMTPIGTIGIKNKELSHVLDRWED